MTYGFMLKDSWACFLKAVWIFWNLHSLVVAFGDRNKRLRLIVKGSICFVMVSLSGWRSAQLLSPIMNNVVHMEKLQKSWSVSKWLSFGVKINVKDLLSPASIGFNYHSVPSDSVPFIDCFGNVWCKRFPHVQLSVTPKCMILII